VRVRGEGIEWVKQARERRLQLRAFVPGAGGLRAAATSSSDLSGEALERLAAETVALARVSAPDPAAGLPEGGFAATPPGLALCDPADRAVEVEARIEQARRAERAARETDPRIVNSEGSEARSVFTRVAAANSAGFAGRYETASHSLACEPVAGENGSRQRDSWVSVARRLADLEDAAELGRRAARRALRRLGARRVRTCQVPVVFEPLVARGLVAQLAACAGGPALYREASWLAGRLGSRIASELVTVVDDGTLPGRLGTRPFDADGLPARRTRLVEAGRLRSYLLDSYAARKLGLASTGHAARGGSAPGVAPTNLWLEPGPLAPEAILAGTARGLLVTELFGPGFNPVTGDFSRGAAGLWIEDGRLAYPVEEITVAGNLAGMLEAVDAVGNDLLWAGRVAAPTVRVARMTVAGES
jgi:PmbA protein